MTMETKDLVVNGDGGKEQNKVTGNVNLNPLKVQITSLVTAF
jgi:hypothetical protein